MSRACSCFALVASACATSAQDRQLRHLSDQVEAMQGALARTDAQLAAWHNEVTMLAAARSKSETQAPARPSAVPPLTVVHLAPDVAELREPDAPQEGRGDEPVRLSLPPEESAETLFGRALLAYQRGAASRAYEGFAAFLRRYPDHPDADSARFWQGECKFEAGLYEDAIARFSALQREHPRSVKAPDALFKVALAYEKLRRPEKASEAFARLIAGYPGSASAELARGRVMRRGTEGSDGPRN